MYTPANITDPTRRLGVLALALAAGVALHAQATSSISGRVTDSATRLPLSGVSVSIPGTNIETFTDSTGDYHLSGVPVGDEQVRFAYVGYEAFSRSVAVSNAGAHLDAAFGEETVELERFVIQGAVVGTARALNEQRAAISLTNVVASDQIGNFPDENAAEALQRVPGLALYRDQGEGRYIIVRGVNYGLNSVSLNGANLASPEEGDRGLSLDVIPSDAISSVEIVKVPTPDMDAEGLGGRVNIKTKSPFDSEGTDASFNAEGLYSDLSGKMGYKFDGSFSTLFDDGKMGVLISPSYQKRKFGSYNFEEDGYSLLTSPTDGKQYYALDAVNFRDYQIERERYGATAAIEYKPSDDSHFYLRSTYHRFTDHEYRNRSVFDFTEADNLDALTADSAEFSDMRRWRRDVRLRHKIQKLTALTLGGETRMGDWALDGQVAWSEGQEKNPDEASVRYRHNARDGAFRYATDGPYSITLTQLAGGDIADPGTYSLQRIDYQVDSGNESEVDAALNARLDLDLSQPAYLKFGAAYRTKDKDKEVEAYELTGGPSDFTYANLSGGLSDYPYIAVPRIDGDKASAAFYPNIAAFDSERVFDDSTLDDWRTTEDVYAAYGMGSMKFDSLTVIAGLRVERTSSDFTGNDADLVNETYTVKTVSRDYTDWLPGIYLRYDLGEHTVARASWSHSISRPAFSDSAAFVSINQDDNEITAGNPYLDALESTNWDASIDYYLPSLGVVSASVFYKDIKNFSYEEKYENGAGAFGYTDHADFDYITYRNGSDGDILGLELAYQQQFHFLPAPFDGLGVLANVTFSDSSAKYPTRPGEDLPFIGNSDRIGNLALTYEKGGFFVRAAINFRSKRLREDEPIGSKDEMTAGDRYVDDFHQIDLTMRYRINHNWEVYAEGVNLTNEPFRVYFNSPGTTQGKRLVQFEEYGWSANFGVRWKL